MNKGEISILMAVYNCADTLRQSIDSVLAQTYTDWKMIICDDCSTDDTPIIINEYKERHPDKFVIIKNEINSYEHLKDVDKIWEDVAHTPAIINWKWYLSRNPKLNSYKRTISMKYYAESEGTIRELMLDARPLVKEGNVIMVSKT